MQIMAQIGSFSFFFLSVSAEGIREKGSAVFFALRWFANGERRAVISFQIYNTYKNLICYSQRLTNNIFAPVANEQRNALKLPRAKHI